MFFYVDRKPVYPKPTSARLLSRAARSSSGASAVEFAMVSPVLIFMMLGMLAYGLYLGAVHSVQQLAADAARASVAGINAAEREEITSLFIKRNADSYLLLRPEHLSVSTEMNALDENQFKVSVSYDTSHLPIWNFGLGLPLPSKQIVRTSTIRIGGV